MSKKTDIKLLPLEAYDLLVVSFSGGKDSTACFLHLLDLGIPRQKIQLWHQRVDGDNEDPLMDWPITEGYCRALAQAFGVGMFFQWKDGGFEGEMLREKAMTRGAYYDTQAGETAYLPPSTRGKEATRRKFPQVSADLSVRWCSPYLKIDVAARALNNDPDLVGKKILFITGERAQESASRARYAQSETHRSNAKKRLVHHWRPVHQWGEDQVWDILRRYRVNPHPAYHLGWGRVSCLACIFGDKHQWASVRRLAPERFEKIARYEEEFNLTIQRKKSVRQQASEGMAFDESRIQMAQKMLAMSREYPVPSIFVDGWELPSGAFRSCGGPS